MIRHALVSVLALALTACGAEPIRTGETGNADVGAGMIATVDGCRIWRIRDGNNGPIYFARCPEGAETTSWVEGCGKNCVRHVQTVGDAVTGSRSVADAR